MQMLDTTETRRRTRFLAVKLPKTQRFACSKKDIKSTFPNQELDSVSFRVHKSFSLGAGYSPRPKLLGAVLTHLNLSRFNEIDQSPSLYRGPHLTLYAVLTDQYPQAAAKDFKSTILPKMKEWLNHQLSKPATLKRGNSEAFLVEWAGNKHRCHLLRWN
jgi:hypothetical protein